MQLIIDITPRELAEALERLGFVDGDDDCDDCDCEDDDDDIPPLTYCITIDPTTDKDFVDALKKLAANK